MQRRQWSWMTLRWMAVDSEPQMAVNRLIVGVVAIGFNLWSLPAPVNRGQAVAVAAAYAAFGALILIALRGGGRAILARRVIALLADCGAASYELHIGGAATQWLFAGYLWIVFGNGFRFGAWYLRLSMAVALVGFSVMVVTTPYWRHHPAVVLGGFMSLTVVPLYAQALITRLSRAREAAEQASQAKSLFLTSVSHELRTPLTAIIGMANLLDRSDLTDAQQRMSETILTAARSLLSMIDGLLDVARIETGRVSVTAVDFDLMVLLGNIRTMFRLPCREKGLALNLHVTARTPLRLHGDGRKFHDILLNLVGNAFKFTESGHITIGVDCRGESEGRALVHVEVADSGPGIEPHELPGIFEMFSQANPTVHERYGGIGLGLTLVRNNVAVLGGTIAVDSMVGEGSRFSVTIPLARQAPDTDPLAHASPLSAVVLQHGSASLATIRDLLAGHGVQLRGDLRPGPVVPGLEGIGVIGFAQVLPTMRDDERDDDNGLVLVGVCAEAVGGLPPLSIQRHCATTMVPDLGETDLERCLVLIERLCRMGERPQLSSRLDRADRRFRVLLADDNSTNRMVLEMSLTAGGYAVTVTRNGQEALAALAESQFDVAIFDVNMQVMGGIEAAVAYVGAVRAADLVPIIGLTADATTATRLRCLDAGMVVCAIKPVEPEALLRLVHQVVTGGDAAIADAAIRNSAVGAVGVVTKSALPLPPAIGSEALSGLRRLGGDRFLHDVLVTVQGEIAASYRQLQEGGARGDEGAFRAHAHALRSVSAHIGAHHLAALCLPGQSSSGQDLREWSAIWLAAIGEEIERVTAALTAMIDDSSASRDFS
ncbi:ATP-binding response regulator [Acidiphilium sp.]|uniref:hybrid sensor histidine kinase/response regulator n=1 Tax=Acidiphilium sp. TaxID=527 RepID=UPI003D06EC87